MKYDSKSLVTAKRLLISRLSYVLTDMSKKESCVNIASRAGVNVNTIYRLRRNLWQGTSMDSALLVAQALKLRYRIAIDYMDSKDPKVILTLAGITSKVPIVSGGDINIDNYVLSTDIKFIDSQKSTSAYLQ